MNERLKELMLNAGYAAPEIAGRAQVLAELIIKECASVCTQAIITNQETLSKLNKDELAEIMIIHGAINQAQKLSKGIKQHFGVEE